MKNYTNTASNEIWLALNKSTEFRSVADLRGDIECTLSHAAHVLRAWAGAGYAIRKEVHRAEGLGAPTQPLYAPVPRAPVSAPAMRADGTVHNMDPAMSGKELARIRKQLNLSGVAFGRALGWNGHYTTLSRNVRRYESGSKPITEALASRARALMVSDE